MSSSLGGPLVERNRELFRLGLVTGALPYAILELRSIEAQRAELERPRETLQIDVNAIKEQLSEIPRGTILGARCYQCISLRKPE